MIGLFGTLDMASRSLQVQRQGVEVAGHNLANVNNPAYSRQRLSIVTSPTIPSSTGPLGTGADVAGVRQLRSSILDQQIQGETGVAGFLTAQQSALQLGEAILGQSINRAATESAGSSTTGGGMGLAEGLSSLFNTFQDVATHPTSVTERQSVLMQAENLTNQFNQIVSRLDTLGNTLDSTIEDAVTKVNDLLAIVANYNKQITATEAGAPGVANDLRDLRQQRIEELAELVNLQTSEQPNGSLNLSVGGTSLILGPEVQDTLETYDAGGGQLMVRTKADGAPLALTGGTIAGTIEARDGALTTLRTDLDTLASQLISQVNAIHRSGFGLSGTTGADLFTGTRAADIGVNQALLEDPSLLQISGVSGAAGDNQVGLALAQLADAPLAGLGNQTFSENYAHTVAVVGQALWSINSALGDQEVVQKMLSRQRDAVSGVSLDEEMTDLIKYQQAFQASARLITTVDEMLDTVVNLKR
jgi:flagellar hook-associated protein 1